MCCRRKSECYLVLLLMAAICLSALVLVPMFILTHPGDECLLFISVRGEALIYGNPVGCNFISYGHCVTIAGGNFKDTFFFFFYCSSRNISFHWDLTEQRLWFDVPEPQKIGRSPDFSRLLFCTYITSLPGTNPYFGRLIHGITKPNKC